MIEIYRSVGKIKQAQILKAAEVLEEIKSSLWRYIFASLHFHKKYLLLYLIATCLDDGSDISVKVKKCT